MNSGTWIAVGIAIGVAIGAVWDSIGIAVGIAIGAGIGGAMYAYASERKPAEKHDSGDDERR